MHDGLFWQAFAAIGKRLLAKGWATNGREEGRPAALSQHLSRLERRWMSLAASRAASSPYLVPPPAKGLPRFPGGGLRAGLLSTVDANANSDRKMTVNPTMPAVTISPPGVVNN